MLHVFWFIPSKNEASHVVSDGYANQPTEEPDDASGEVWEKTHNEYYHNAVEDKNHLSIAVREPFRLESQRNFVEQAIAQGKAHEVHPETMRRYREGTLGFESTKYDDTIRALEQQDRAVGFATGRYTHTMPIDYGEQYNEEVHSSAHDYKTYEEINRRSDEARAQTRLSRGPDVERIRNRLELDDQENHPWGEAPPYA